MHNQPKRKYCDDQLIRVRKDGLCVDSECQAKCREKRGAKAKSWCSGIKSNIAFAPFLVNVLVKYGE